jgi:ABC-2 type transport system ATP-binding protein
VRQTAPVPGSPPALVLRQLRKRYGTVDALAGLDLVVERCSVTAVLGANGAGKTSALECCVGLRQPDSGEIRVLDLDPARDAGAIHARVGVMLQEGAGLAPPARTGALLRHAAALYAHPLDAADLAARLGLDGSLATPVRRLSGGQRQRLALGLAVIGRPELVFLDEPSAGLDPHARREAWALIADLQASGVTVVLTTHLLDEAERLADHVVIVDHGRAVAAGSPADLTGTAHDVTFSGPPRLDLSRLRAALPVAATLDEVAPGRYRVSGPVDPHLLATVTAWCAANDVLPEGLRVSRRTLEDVFLELTGRPAPSDAESGPQPGHRGGAR